MCLGAGVIIFLGPPGSGKGTQAARLSSALGIPAVSTGEMLRREAQCGSALGTAVHNVLASGQLVSDRLINQVIARRLSHADCERGCILDGFPRTVAQAQYLDTMLLKFNVPAPIVFDFDISCEEVVCRLSCRRECPQCGRIFGAAGSSNDSGLFCDRDGALLVQRVDDHPATIRERLRVYAKNATELISYYQTRDYHRICATRSPAEISDQLTSLLGLQWSTPALVGAAKAVLQTGYPI